MSVHGPDPSRPRKPWRVAYRKPDGSQSTKRFATEKEAIAQRRQRGFGRFGTGEPMPAPARRAPALAGSRRQARVLLDRGFAVQR